ncbi:MAG: magnesium protoporphyrin IX methyltransferase [Pseudomonadota bacterium]
MSDTYSQKRGQLEDYFDRTAAETWTRLTSDAPVSRIRQTVRAGRDAMRSELLRRLPQNLAGRRVLDAGCGAGQASAELARRGAEVVAVDISPKLLAVAEARLEDALKPRVRFQAGDMLNADLGRFDHVLAMDSLIHYAPGDIVRALSGLAERTTHSVVFTVAPRTPLLSVMHAAGKLFPRGDRSPAIQPIAESELKLRVAREGRLGGWVMPASTRIKSGFYISQAMELRK